MERQPQPALLKFAEEDIADEEVAVKTLRNNSTVKLRGHSAVKLRGRSLSLGQKVRLDHGSRRRRLLSHGRAVQMIRRKRAVSFPPATSTTITSPTQPTADSSVLSLATPDKSCSTPTSGLKGSRAGVFERSWADVLVDDAAVTANAPVECSRSESVDTAITDPVPFPVEDQQVISASANDTVTADVEDIGGKIDPASPVNDVSCDPSSILLAICGIVIIVLKLSVIVSYLYSYVRL